MSVPRSVPTAVKAVEAGETESLRGARSTVWHKFAGIGSRGMRTGKLSVGYMQFIKLF